jgi:hypothetical protein
LLAGCSDSSDELLQGIWVNSTTDWPMSRYILEGNRWEIDIRSYYQRSPAGADGGTSSGGRGIQIQSGTFTQSGKTLHFETARSSCQGVVTVSATRSATYKVVRVGDPTLISWSDDAGLFYEETTPPSGMADAPVGCFENGYVDFTPHAIESVP